MSVGWRYDARMSGLPAVVWGSIIAGGAALIGYGASALTTRATVRASRQAAQDQRLWEKRSVLYEAVMRIVSDFQPHTATRKQFLNVNKELYGQRPAMMLYAPDLVQQAFWSVWTHFEDWATPGGRLDVDNNEPRVEATARNEATNLLNQLEYTLQKEIQETKVQGTHWRLAPRRSWWSVRGDDDRPPTRLGRLAANLNRRISGGDRPPEANPSEASE